MTDPLARLNAFLARAAFGGDLGAIVGELCERLVGDGLPLWRVSIGLQTLDPVIRARTTIWRRDRAAARAATTHEDGQGPFLRSPIRVLMDGQATSGRWRVAAGEGQGLQLLDELRAEGCTDYVMHLVRFDTTRLAVPGAALGFATDRPGGFGDAELATLAALVPALGLAAARASLTELTATLLEVYLGARSARNVLRGEIRRGQGREIEAAILLADLAGFTRLTERANPLAVVGWLDEHLDGMVAAVTAAGGEVLKFLGDGLLAVFPAGDGVAAADACAQALAAAQAAQAANAVLNEARSRVAAPTLGLDVALHYGTVVYGNVGSPSRLDFTVIGRAVNEASRIEALCGPLGEPLALSAAFAARCGRPTRGLGAHVLRGLERPQEIHAPA